MVGIRDSALSQRLQLNAELTLEKAKINVCQQEAVGEQQQVLRGPANSGPSLDELQPHRNGCPRGRFSCPKRSGNVPTVPTQSKPCQRCGKGQHPREKYPAKDATCHKCQKKGRFQSQCRTKNVSHLEGYDDADGAFLDTVATQQSSTWTIEVRVPFKMDTGAEVTAVSPETHKTLKQPKLTPATKVLYGPSQTWLNVRGTFDAILSRGGKTSSVRRRGSKDQSTRIDSSRRIETSGQSGHY